MAVNHLIVTNNFTGQSNLTFDPSDYYIKGLSEEGSITFIAYNYQYPLSIALRDSNGSAIAEYDIQNGETVSLKSAFPGINLDGKYLTSEFVTFNQVYIVTPYTACKGPEWCVLDQYYTAGEGVKITWGAGTSGQNNPIDRYDVWCKEYDANDNDVGDWFIATRSPNANTLEATVYPPDTPGNWHYYWVHAVGQNASNDEDDYEGCYVDWGLTRVTACTAPSYCRLSATESTGEAVTLSWGAGQSGVENALAGYEVWAAPYDPNGDYPSDELWEYIGETGTNVRTMQVYPPDTPGAYYLFSVLSVGENYYSGDEWCDSENLLRRTSGAYGWTDPVLTARESYIRAVYITEMQDRTNAMRTARGKAAYPFTKVTAGVTKIAKWAALIQEIRTAIDGMAVSHEAWAAISEGKPRIEHVMQIRRILDGM